MPEIHPAPVYSHMNGQALKIVPIDNRASMRAFINLPWSIYADDPAWIAPLRLERRLHFSRFNPFFKHAEWQAWLAYRNGAPVGRISAQINRLHQQQYGPDTGQFGLIEAIEDTDVFAVLTTTAEQWLRERNVTHVTGPFNLSINQESGVLVDGFSTPPVFMMPHSRPWYGAMLEQQAYTPAQDLLAYWIQPDFTPSRTMDAIMKRFRNRVRVRPIQRKNFARELETMRDIFNDAWSQNWGFIPFTAEEFTEMGNSLRLIVSDGLIQIAEVEGVPTAFMVTLPNLNEVLRDLNGSLLPTGWLKLFRHVRQKRFKTARVALMGVRKAYQNTPAGLAQAFMLIDESRKIMISEGIEGVELSWILESNTPMRNILNNIGSDLYKRYRVYEKTLQVT